MKKLNPILEQILFTRFLNNLSEQTSAVAGEIGAMAGEGIAGLRGLSKGVRRAPKGTYELPKEVPSSYFPRVPSSFEMPSSIKPADYFKTIVDSEIEAAVSRTTNPEEIVQYITSQQTGELLSTRIGSEVADYVATRVKERLGQVTTPAEIPASPELQPIRIPEVPTPYSPPALPEAEPMEVETQPLAYTGVELPQTSPASSTSLASALSPMTQPQYAMMIGSLLKTATKTAKPKNQEDEDEDEDYDVPEEEIDMSVKSSDMELPGSAEKAEVDLQQTKLGKYSGSYRLK